MAASMKKGERKRPGPKPRPASETRRNRIMLNLSDSEFASLERAADGRPASDFAREIVLRYLARRR